MLREVDGFVFVTLDGRVGQVRKDEPLYLSDISDYVDSRADDLWPLNKTVHDNPELGFKEIIAHAALTKFFKEQEGWKVTPSAYGMATAWVAVWDSGKKGPVISYNVEMDSLEGIGHACGHNLIMTASVAGGLATAEMMSLHHLGGKVVVFGTPAEEGGGGKIKLLEAGAYKDYGVDVNLISHPGITGNNAMMRTSAYTMIHVEYFGREAHAAASPWLGINALDAMVTAYNAISVLRQQCMPGDVIQGHITNGGVRPNIIHAYTAGNWVIRANTQARLEELKKKVTSCFEAGSTATGAKLKITPKGSYADHVPNRAMSASYTKYFNELSPSSLIPIDQDVDAIQGRTMASTDQGDISYAMPSLSPSFAIAPGPGGNGPHNPEFAEAAGTRDAFERALRVGKGLAGAAVDILSTEGLLATIKDEWKEDIKGNAM
ncbi:hypothetical protein BKA67DRAFT_523011 [Truncatella angustata]|uniref:Peptidase M20 domain-containing protein 2 n=1 Tax=Truncatella angustata TaxID=152316 RepID=A0A9P8UE81_9PEZI|nr:uncharacterized protein BKA67DRAFT_523011 [Truncatella angustata]KAH6648328.1 hypothetical protein BKA67DRAFT_523011 [Truncatella angustata]KAH8201649.1 hypothetical protein TruAng_004170 [Truncatella angustata]